MKQGTVVKSTGSWYVVYSEGEMLSCRIRGKLKLQDRKVTNPVAVGEYVKITEECKDESVWVITEIVPRKNYIIRESPRKKAHAHIIASNIDLALILATYTYPKTSLGFIDRFLVTAESYHIPAAIVFNKSDILRDEDLEEVKFILKGYERLGYQVLIISAQEQEDFYELTKILQGKTTLISGHSGVGKSTLINRLVPEAQQKVAKVSNFASKGTHTTTFAEMFFLDEHTAIIDTPGIKEFGLMDISPDELDLYFPEMRDLSDKCKFHNCTHTHEPGCAILAALEQGEINPDRFQSYLSMLENDDNRR